jgi:predicted acylesterase/phospholipase RssA
MNATHDQDKNATHLSDLHLVCGSGGTRAFLTGAGTILACDAAGVKNWNSIGGVSGGSIISALYAGGMPAPALVEEVISYDFATLFRKTGTLYEMIRSHLPRRPKTLERRAIREGIMKSDGLGAIIEEHVTEWPANFWTMAVSGKYQILFTADGVFQTHRGLTTRISDRPAPLGLAIRASCAVPGILESIEYLGRHLFDGALSDFGECPTGIVQRHFFAPAHKIVACDVSGMMTRQRRALFALGRLISGRISQRLNPANRAGEIFIAPKVEHLGGSLEFTLTREQKEAAVLSGFAAAVEVLARSGVLLGDRLTLCQEASRSYKDLYRLLISDTRTR